MPKQPPFPPKPFYPSDPGPDEGEGVKQYFPLDSYDSGYYLVQGPNHTALLQEAIRLARRLVSYHFRTQTEKNESTRIGTVFVSSKTGYQEIRRSLSSPSEMSINLKVIEHAAEAEYRSLVPGASLEARAKRHRHVLFIAILLVHEQLRMMEMRKSMGDSASSPSSTESGWEFEKQMFGGSLVRLVDGLRFSDPDTFIIGYLGLAVTIEEGGVGGYFIVPDEITEKIVKGGEGWQDLLPLNITEHTVNGFVAGHHPDAMYRAGDGSKVVTHSGNDVYCGTHTHAGLRKIPIPSLGLQ